MKHIAIISTSYPTEQDGSEAAGSFVADFAATLSEKLRVTVIAPGLQASEQQLTDSLKVVRFKVPRLLLSLLKAQHPGSWPAIFKTLRAGQQAVNDVMLTTDIDINESEPFLFGLAFFRQTAQRKQCDWTITETCFQGSDRKKCAAR